MSPTKNRELSKFTDAQREGADTRLGDLREKLFELEAIRDRLELQMRDCRDAIYAEETAIRLNHNRTIPAAAVVVPKGEAETLESNRTAYDPNAPLELNDEQRQAS